MTVMEKFKEHHGTLVLTGSAVDVVRQTLPNIENTIAARIEDLKQAISAISTVEYVGDDEQAVAYLYRQYPSPSLYRVRDVMTRGDDLFKDYLPDTYDMIRKGLKVMLQRPGTVIMEIVGRRVDTKIVEQFISVMDELKLRLEDQRIQCYRIPSDGLMMNFVVLDYKDADSEVLFGWAHAPGWPGAVCRSRNRKLVEEFIAFYEFLRERSAKVSARSLMLPPALSTDVTITERLNALEVYRSFAHHYFITKDRQGKQIWIYARLTFECNHLDGTLTAIAATVPEPGEERQANLYEFKASIDSTNLIIKTRRIDGTSDIGIELFPHADAFPRCLYGMRMVASTFAGHPASSIAILSKVPLVQDARDGEPLQNEGTLQADWESFSGTKRLPG
jgi:hypothetical protein